MRLPSARNVRHLVSPAFDAVRDRNRPDRAAVPWWYFMHIEKTAGSSVLYSLYDVFRQWEIYPNYRQLRFEQGSQYLDWDTFRRRELERFPPTKTLLVGHFGVEPLRHWESNPPRGLTFLRRPEARVASSIVYHQVEGRRYQGMSIDDVLDLHLPMEASVQLRALGWEHEHGDDLGAALAVLDRMAFVGLTERYEEGLRVLSDVLGRPDPLRPKRLNVATAPPDLTVGQRDRIAEATVREQRLYEYAVRRFDDLADR